LVAQKNWTKEMLEKEGFHLMREHPDLQLQLWANNEDGRYRVFINFREQTISAIYPLTDWFPAERINNLVAEVLDRIDELIEEANDGAEPAGVFELALTKELEILYPEFAGGMATLMEYLALEVTVPLEGWYLELLLTTKAEEVFYELAKCIFGEEVLNKLQELAENIPAMWEVEE